MGRIRGPYLLEFNNPEEARKIFAEIGCDPMGIELMKDKIKVVPLLIKDIKSPAANVLKQHLLSSGGDAVVARWVVNNSREQSDVILLGTMKQYIYLLERLVYQPWGLKELAKRIKGLLNNLGLQRTISWQWPGKQLTLGERTLVMGILNITPDSFSDGGRFLDINKAVNYAHEMAASGADVIDIGGESTRPGSVPLSTEEEIDRIMPVLEILLKELPVPVSLDTYKSKVAETALKQGLHIVNDVGGGKRDPDMARIAAEYDAPVIIMHNPGEHSGDYYDYGDVAADVVDQLGESINIFEDAGLSPHKIMIDPGIGFGKNKADNLKLIKDLDYFKILNKPVLLGASRKSFIGKVLDAQIGQRLEGSLAVVSWAVQKGIDMVRVHDVKETVRTVRMLDAIRKAGEIGERIR